MVLVCVTVCCAACRIVVCFVRLCLVLGSFVLSGALHCDVIVRCYVVLCCVLWWTVPQYDGVC